MKLLFETDPILALTLEVRYCDGRHHTKGVAECPNGGQEETRSSVLVSANKKDDRAHPSPMRNARKSTNVSCEDG